MRKFIFPLIMVLLTGCPNEKEIKEIINESTDKRQQAVSVIKSQDFSLEGLLKAQEYFFDFSEKVHLMKEDPKSLESIKTLIQKNGLKGFCEKFIVSVQLWQNLENYCSSSIPYKCSPDIQSYQDTVEKFLALIGKELEGQFQKESACQ